MKPLYNILDPTCLNNLLGANPLDLASKAGCIVVPQDIAADLTRIEVQNQILKFKFKKILYCMKYYTNRGLVSTRVIFLSTYYRKLN